VFNGMSNKRIRTEDVQPRADAVAANSPRGQKQLRLSNDLATKLGTQYCPESDLIAMMLSQKMCSRVSTFEVKATLMGDLNEWMTITLDDEHASVADVKRGVELSKGLRPAMQELFRYDDKWTGTKSSGGSGHSAAQEEAALLEEGFMFEGPCSVVVSVNELYDVVLEGQEEDNPCRVVMGVYERVEGKEVNGRGVWQALGGIGRFLYYFGDGGNWVVSNQDAMEEGDGAGRMFVDSTAATPDQVTEEWEVDDGTAWVAAPKLRVRVCSSAEKQAAVQRMKQEQKQALAQAQQVHTLVVEGIADDQNGMMGEYKLMEGKVVNGRPVWKKDGLPWTLCLYYATSNKWIISIRQVSGHSSNWIRAKVSDADDIYCAE
jgi:hypothetical protein